MLVAALRVGENSAIPSAHGSKSQGLTVVYRELLPSTSCTLQNGVGFALAAASPPSRLIGTPSSTAYPIRKKTWRYVAIIAVRGTRGR